jgi:hypothetical protein
MAKLPKIPEGMSTNLPMPSLSQIVVDNQFPAYLRMVAMDLSGESYSTVGSVLSKMCNQDLCSLSNDWVRQTSQAAEEQRGDEEDDGEENSAFILRLTNPATLSYLIFTAMIVKAETGEAKFDPLLTGFQAELLASFMQAIVVANQFERVTLDLTKFTLNMEFLDQNFEYIMSTDNFKAMKYVAQLKDVWRKMQKSEVLALLRAPKEPVKEEFKSSHGRGPFGKFKTKTERGGETFGSFKDMAASLNQTNSEEPKEEPASKGSSLSDLEARLRKLSGG